MKPMKTLDFWRPRAAARWGPREDPRRALKIIAKPLGIHGIFEDRAMESMETLVHPHAPRNGARRGSDTHSVIPSQDRAGTRGRGPPLWIYVTSELDSTCTSSNSDTINLTVFFNVNDWKTQRFRMYLG